MAKQWTVEQMGTRLKKYVRKLELKDDLPQSRQTIMDYAKLTGQLVDKSEQVQLSVEDQAMIARLVEERVQALLLARTKVPGSHVAANVEMSDNMQSVKLPESPK